MKYFLTGLSLFFMAACASPSPAPPIETKVPEPTKDYSEANMTLCAAAGGNYQRAGMLGWYRCTLPYSDGGKACSDSAHCEGKCLAGPDNGGDWTMEKGGARGACQANDNPFGCYSELINGRVGPALCVD